MARLSVSSKRSYRAPSSGSRARNLASWLTAAVAVIGLCVTAAVAFNVTRGRGVYWAEAQVRFLMPSSAANPNVLQISPMSLIIAAGAVEKIVGEPNGPRVIDPANTLANQGIKHGYGVSLPNQGGQWASHFTDPWLEVQAVGSSPDEVVAQANRLVKKVDAALADMQRRAHVDRYNLIHTQLSPQSGPAVYYQAGSRSRAGAGVLVLGGVLTWIAVSLLRRYTHGHHPGAQQEFVGIEPIGVPAGVGTTPAGAR